MKQLLIFFTSLCRRLFQPSYAISAKYPKQVIYKATLMYSDLKYHDYVWKIKESADYVGFAASSDQEINPDHILSWLVKRLANPTIDNSMYYVHISEVDPVEARIDHKFHDCCLLKYPLDFV